MSTGLECTFIQTTPTEWFYLLQDGDCPVSCWDWREHATAYGPFPTQDEAEDHLDRNHANPGGWSVHSLVEGATEAKLDEPVQQAIATARARPRRSERGEYALRQALRPRG
jgi:hypothetical protein